MRWLTAKQELNTASLLLIPIPRSAYFRAIKSLAPSPTMPTLLQGSDIILPQKDSCLCFEIMFCFIFFTMRALFSGEVLAKTLTLLWRNPFGF